ncbi:MAG: hypothetical protein K0R54_2963 [Clostridiaceae bacterium]|nr:hypothetical protein [Clostridiaceae bacterium]
MNTVKDNMVFIILVYINIIFNLSVMSSCFQINNFSFGSVTLIYISSILMWILYRDILKTRKHRIYFTTGILILIILFIHYRVNINSIIQLYVNNAANIGNSIFNGTDADYNLYSPFVAVLLPIISLIVLVFTHKKFQNFIMVITFIVMLSYWYTGYDQQVKNNLFKFLMISLITYASNKYKENERKLKKIGVNTNNSFNNVFIYIIISSIIISGLSRMLPQNFLGKYDGSIITKLQNKFAVNKKSEGDIKNKYNISFAGYSDSNIKLGGPVSVNDLTAFKIKFDEENDENKPMYFTGSVKDKYDGFSWKKIKNNYVDQEKVPKYTEGFIEPLNGEKRLTIYPDELRSSTLFVPRYTKNIIVSEDGKAFVDEYGSYINSGLVNKSYNIQYYGSSDMADNLFINFPSSNYISEIMSREYNATIDNSAKEKGEEVRSQYKEFLQLPDNISNRTIELVNNITKDKQGSYYKAKAIFDYLSLNYKYTLDVSEVPQGQEFLDYFLFTEKKGYCTYFATAATIMCRIAGIPARYVEGFHITDKRDNDGLYVASNKNAHAWCEFLASPSKNMWAILDPVPNSTDLILKEEQLKKEQAQNELENKQYQVKKKQNTKDINDNVNQSNSKSLFNRKIIFIISILAVLAVSLCIRTIFIVVKTKAILRNTSIIPMYNQLLKRLKRSGIIKKDNISDMEFAANINELELRFKMVSLVKIAYEEFYGGKQNVNVDKKSYMISVEEYLKKTQGKPRYYIEKLIFY